MAGHFELHQARFQRELLQGRDGPLRRLFYARPEHSQFVLLAFFTDEDSTVRQFLDEHLRIASFESVAILLPKPTWARRGSEDPQKWDQDGDSRFWGARGVVQKLLSRISDIAVSSAIVDEGIELVLGSYEELQELRRGYESQGDLFKGLESLFLSFPNVDIRVKVRTSDSRAGLLYRELSEGEQQLLTVLGLLRFTKQDESLLLLDEPDTHLNPRWSIEYRRLIESVGGAFGSSHTLIASHDPLLIADLKRDEVRLLSRAGDGAVIGETPDEAPRGSGVAGLLTGPLYELDTQLDLTTYAKLREKQELASQDVLSHADSDRLRRLNAELDFLPYRDGHVDPVYQLWLTEMSRWRHANLPNTPALSESEFEAQRDFARELFDSLRSNMESPRGPGD